MSYSLNAKIKKHFHIYLNSILTTEEAAVFQQRYDVIIETIRITAPKVHWIDGVTEHSMNFKPRGAHVSIGKCVNFFIQHNENVNICITLRGTGPHSSSTCVADKIQFFCLGQTYPLLPPSGLHGTTNSTAIIPLRSFSW